ncbi:hypothetical protein C8J56DRAFT_723490, partial [Mycena floridula]
ITKELDRKLPFRECMPSRRHITSDGGPYTTARISSPQGIASALIFCGITFASPKIRDHAGYFASLGDWNDFRSTDTEETQFCNRMAYGRTKGRTTANAEGFFLIAPKIDAYLNRIAGDSKSFTTFWKVFKSTKHPEAIHAVTFGDSAALLFAEDLVYAGRLTMPSDNEFASCVAQLDKGAVEGLQKLGLVSLQSSKSEIAAAFLQVCYIPTSANEKAQMGRFDVFLTEHTLCKYSRL